MTTEKLNSEILNLPLNLRFDDEKITYNHKISDHIDFLLSMLKLSSGKIDFLRKCEYGLQDTSFGYDEQTKKSLIKFYYQF